MISLLTVSDSITLLSLLVFYRYAFIKTCDLER